MTVVIGLTGGIGSVMFLSNKTVESHLTHIYRKTGVESRRHLIGWLRGNPAPPER